MHSSHNLLRHDGTIVINEMRSVFSSWTDRLLAIAILPMVSTTLYRALRAQFARHARLARLTFPIWLYVSVTGVVVYWMLYHG